MTQLMATIKLWITAMFLGCLVILSLLKRCFTKGFQVLKYKKRERPPCLDDLCYGTHRFLHLKENVKIHYVISGPEDKPLMLLVHGFPEFWYSWRHQILEFQKDYRVVAIDQRGYSESSKPEGIEHYTMTKLMSDLSQVIQGLGYTKCTLVAHDWGGVVAWAFARKYPELVEKFINMNSPPISLFKSVIQSSNEQYKKSWYVFFFQLPWLPEFTMKSNDLKIFDSMVEKKKDSEEEKAVTVIESEDIAAYKYTFSQPGAFTPAINYYRALLQLNSAVDHDLEYTMPTLLIWGEEDSALDMIIPKTIQELAPKITVKIIKGANHFVQNYAPEEVNKIMRDWLKEE
ncbi:epoxide hydrolase 4-like [Biomphalaria glabrata]|uniref:Epoxide hydrolase 4-like n=1 Tax=Biomphalaria glabrata TaxID=6526 RepID=A0A9W2ZTH4_BIOGL|nr:epoxide hydrolase 4-like [Biomphalaria glabrata]XP_055878195.1 epoxide hydrolase 4-like [Biomphalaria glabrata]KAI8741554.1 epoxide hydrolase 4-like [Biomphalaria glabrata]